jgi:hypothetical protein
MRSQRLRRCRTRLRRLQEIWNLGPRARGTSPATGHDRTRTRHSTHRTTHWLYSLPHHHLLSSCHRLFALSLPSSVIIALGRPPSLPTHLRFTHGCCIAIHSRPPLLRTYDPQRTHNACILLTIIQNISLSLNLYPIVSTGIYTPLSPVPILALISLLARHFQTPSVGR